MEIWKGDEARRRLRRYMAEIRGRDEENGGGRGGPLRRKVEEILASVRREGDAAIRRWAREVGDPAPPVLPMSEAEIDGASAKVPPATRGVLERAAKNIERFSRAVKDAISPVRVEGGGFVACLDFAPVERVGCYVPAGRHPLPSTALMTAIPARCAGVREVYVACPRPAPEVIYACRIAGVDGIFQMGGAQAVAALAFGTETVPAVDLVAGPGNAWVTEAKRQVQGTVGIDMLAGPSEVAVIADSTANPEWVALDLLAQLEHDPDARAWLLTPCEDTAAAVAENMERLAGEPALPGFVTQADGACDLLVLETLAACAEGANRIAPEHLVLAVADPGELEPRLENYGALFLGHCTTVPLGDYMAGPNHTLPTGGTARFAGGLTPLAFLRPRSRLETGKPRFARAGEEGCGGTPSSPFPANALYEDAAAFAALEGLWAHEAAVRARLNAGERENG